MKKNDIGIFKNFFTVKEMAEKLGISTNTTKHRLFMLNIKPVSTDALYEASTLDIIRDVPSAGRPRKKTSGEDAS
jgi:predicted ArsR family transcriptional regulator